MRKAECDPRGGMGYNKNTNGNERNYEWQQKRRSLRRMAEQFQTCDLGPPETPTANYRRFKFYAEESRLRTNLWAPDKRKIFPPASLAGDPQLSHRLKPLLGLCPFVVCSRNPLCDSSRRSPFFPIARATA